MSSYQAGRRILEVAQRAPDRTALIIDGESWSYAELIAAAKQIAGEFPGVQAGAPQPVTAVMAQRHVSAYAGILAARLAGHAYVPLNVNHPCQRNAIILRSSAAERVVCGELAVAKLGSILQAAEVDAVPVPFIQCGDRKQDYSLDLSGEPGQWPGGREGALTDRAYILFTSGSTGLPKGVPIRNRELEAYLRVAGPLVDVRPDDRFSQTFDLTFDLSVHDMFVCWESGATLVVPSEKDLRMPSAYLRAQAITCWFSVPSLAYQMRLQGDLVPGAFPSLRCSLFCGEALPTLVAREWAMAGPNSIVENWYGPTEATIACSRYAVTESPIEGDTVPIGKAFPGMELLIRDEELLLAGAQVAAGYLNDAEKTAASFITLPDGRPAYRTGDRAAVDDDGNFRFLGRMDSQVKVRGYRIELGEIEAALRTASSGLNAVALAWPSGAEIATSIVAALETDAADTAAIRKRLAAALPDYMVPSLIACVAAFPKNASGKTDRKALAAMLADMARDDDTETSGLSREAEILLKAIQAHAPLLGRRDIMAARNLFDAGVDSLAFVGITTEIEQSLGLSLDQDSVILLAGMSFDEIVLEAQGKTRRLAAPVVDEELTLFDRARRLLGIPRIIGNPRANRALCFIRRFPQYLAERGAPDVLAVGSSGTFRAICPDAFGAGIVMLNAGFPAVSASGMQMLCSFIRQQCEKAQLRIPLIVYELDPMHLSTAPPRGDIDLGPDYFSGNVLPLRGRSANSEFQWLIEAKGAWNAPDTLRRKDREPNWVRERDAVIARAYLGDVEFEPGAVRHWFDGARALQVVSDRMVCFVHPAERTILDELAGKVTGDALTNLVRDIRERLGIDVLPWDAFDLQPDDFRDITHMRTQDAASKLSGQLAAMLGL